MSQPVFYHSGMPGFPAGNTRTAGGLIAVLTACLVNGANLAPAVSLVQTAGVATATFASNHNFNVGDSVEVTGATPAAYNGRKTVTGKTSTSISFAIDPGIAETASGTIEVKHPGAGWARTWSDGNKAAFRSATSDGGIGAYMQIEDDDPYADSHVSFRWRVCEGHTGLDTATRLATGLRRFWKVSDNVQWWVVADDRMAYVQLFGAGTGNAATLFSFGELPRAVPTDTGGWVFPASSTTGGWQAGGGGVAFAARNSASADSYPYQALKSWLGFEVLAAVTPTLIGSPFINPYMDTGWLSDVQRSGSAPNPLTGAVELTPVHAIEQLGTVEAPGNALVRATFPGVYHLLGHLPGAFFDARLTGYLPDVEINGVSRRIVVAKCGQNLASQIAFDLSGPWR